MNPLRPAVVVVGDESLSEMRPVVALVHERSDVEIRRAPEIDDLRRLIQIDGWHPDLIVVLHSWPDQFSGDDVQQLLSLAPLSRIVCVCGAWCDSEGRTHTRWPLAVRVSLTYAGGRIAHEFAAIRGLFAPLPLTAGRGEIFAADFALSEKPTARAMLIAVVSPDLHWRRTISDGLRRVGQRIVGADAQDHPLAILWDADPWDAARCDELHALRRQFPSVRLIASLGFDWNDVANEVRKAGADAVWPKLAPLESLRSLLAGECTRTDQSRLLPTHRR